MRRFMRRFAAILALTVLLAPIGVEGSAQAVPLKPLGPPPCCVNP
jgi:hypothetical protein